jgi:hypothetical protein
MNPRGKQNVVQAFDAEGQRRSDALPTKATLGNFSLLVGEPRPLTRIFGDSSSITSRGDHQCRPLHNGTTCSDRANTFWVGSPSVCVAGSQG